MQKMHVHILSVLVQQRRVSWSLSVLLLVGVVMPHAQPNHHHRRGLLTSASDAITN